MQRAARELYETIYTSQSHQPLYGAPWWLDAACGHEEWDVFLLEQEHQQIAILPCHKTVLRGMKALINPPMTQWLPLISVLENNASFEKFADQDYSILDITVKPEISGFISSGPFKINLKYSYLIPANDNLSEIRSKYNEGLRRNLKESGLHYSIVQSDDIDTFIQLCIATYRQRSIKTPWWVESKIPLIWHALKKQHAGDITFALLKGKPVAGIMTGWDDDTCYYLSGGRMKGEGGVSAHALLLDQAICQAMVKGKSFDFEGSMNPGIAGFFQTFGAKPFAFWQIRQFKGMGRIWSLFH